MRYIIIGYGNIGQKRKTVLGDKIVATVDPVIKNVDFKNYVDVPLSAYDAAVVATPNSVKLEILEYLLSNKKHALVEKPLLIVDNNVAERLKQISKINMAIWYTSYNHRFEPLIGKMKEYLESNVIGEMYFANFIYGNGTVRNVADTWRDEGLGVLDDLGCHLIDLTYYLFQKEINFEFISAHNYETNNFDHISFISTDRQITFTCSYLMWKNTFTIDIYGSKGSVHLDGLNKWGGSSIILRERVLPSGVPKEQIKTSFGRDRTWKKDIIYFEDMVSIKQNSFKKDIKISKAIHTIYPNKRK